MKSIAATQNRKSKKDNLDVLFNFIRELENLTSKYPLPEQLKEGVKSVIASSWKTFDAERSKDGIT